MSIATLNDIFFAIVDRAHERVMMHRQAIQWVPISSHELYRQVAGVSRALDRGTFEVAFPIQATDA